MSQPEVISVSWPLTHPTIKQLTFSVMFYVAKPENGIRSQIPKHRVILGASVGIFHPSLSTKYSTIFSSKVLHERLAKCLQVEFKVLENSIGKN